MKTSSVIKALRKVGLEPVSSESGHSWVVTGPRYYATWTDKDGEATCLYVCANGLRDDTMTDCFPGFFPSTIKMAINFLDGNSSYNRRIA